MDKHHNAAGGDDQDLSTKTLVPIEDHVIEENNYTIAHSEPSPAPVPVTSMPDLNAEEEQNVVAAGSQPEVQTAETAASMPLDSIPLPGEEVENIPLPPEEAAQVDSGAGVEAGTAAESAILVGDDSSLDESQVHSEAEVVQTAEESLEKSIDEESVKSNGTSETVVVEQPDATANTSTVRDAVRDTSQHILKLEEEELVATVSAEEDTRGDDQSVETVSAVEQAIAESADESKEDEETRTLTEIRDEKGRVYYVETVDEDNVYLMQTEEDSEGNVVMMEEEDEDYPECEENIELYITNDEAEAPAPRRHAGQKGRTPKFVDGAIPTHLIGTNLKNPIKDSIKNGKAVKPRMGVKVPYKNLTSQIVSKQEITKAIVERAQQRTVDRSEPPGGSGFFAAKMGKRLASKILDETPPSPIKRAPLKASDAKSKESAELENEDLLAILEGKDDTRGVEGMVVAPVLTAEQERALALKQLQDICSDDEDDDDITYMLVAGQMAKGKPGQMQQTARSALRKPESSKASDSTPSKRRGRPRKYATEHQGMASNRRGSTHAKDSEDEVVIPVKHMKVEAPPVLKQKPQSQIHQGIDELSSPKPEKVITKAHHPALPTDEITGGSSFSSSRVVKTYSRKRKVSDAGAPISAGSTASAERTEVHVKVEAPVEEKQVRAHQTASAKSSSSTVTKEQRSVAKENPKVAEKGGKPVEKSAASAPITKSSSSSTTSSSTSSSSQPSKSTSAPIKSIDNNSISSTGTSTVASTPKVQPHHAPQTPKVIKMEPQPPSTPTLYMTKSSRVIKKKVIWDPDDVGVAPTVSTPKAGSATPQRVASPTPSTPSTGRQQKSASSTTESAKSAEPRKTTAVSAAVGVKESTATAPPATSKLATKSTTESAQKDKIDASPKKTEPIKKVEPVKKSDVAPAKKGSDDKKATPSVTKTPEPVVPKQAYEDKSEPPAADAAEKSSSNSSAGTPTKQKLRRLKEVANLLGDEGAINMLYSLKTGNNAGSETGETRSSRSTAAAAASNAAATASASTNLTARAIDIYDELTTNTDKVSPKARRKRVPPVDADALMAAALAAESGPQESRRGVGRVKASRAGGRKHRSESARSSENLSPTLGGAASRIIRRRSSSSYSSGGEDDTEDQSSQGTAPSIDEEEAHSINSEGENFKGESNKETPLITNNNRRKLDEKEATEVPQSPKRSKLDLSNEERSRLNEELSETFDRLTESEDMATEDEQEAPTVAPVTREKLRAGEVQFCNEFLQMSCIDAHIYHIELPGTLKFKGYLTTEILRELTKLLAELDDNDNCHVVLFTSTAPNFLCGVDLHQIANDDEQKALKGATELAYIIREFLLALSKFAKPLIAGIGSACAKVSGIGLTMLTLFDVVVSVDSASFDSKAAYGSATIEGGCLLAPHRTISRQLLFMDEKLSAAQALRGGLITQCVWLQNYPYELARTVNCVAKKHIDYLKATKVQLRQHGQEATVEAIKAETESLIKQWTSTECQKYLKTHRS